MNKNSLLKITKQIISMYPNAKSSLNFTTPLEMLVAVCLSAQCTDERVNKTTPAIFNKYKTAKDYANANKQELEALVHPCGFYKNKTQNLINAGKKIEKDFNGEVPNDMQLLQTIPGVGRKSANCIMLDAFNNPQGIAVDTHVKRIANRLGFSKETDPLKIEQDLLVIIPRKYWKDVNHTFIMFGREICTAQNPQCSHCKFKTQCNYFIKTRS